MSRVKNDFPVQQSQTTGLALSAQIYIKYGLFMGEGGICIPKLKKKKNPSLSLGMMIVNIKAMSLAVKELSLV